MIGKARLMGGILLVCGTTIGAGMLALPVSTGSAGFLPSLLLLVLYWVYMTYTAFLMLEATLWMAQGTNLISMARRTLGKWGEGFSWTTYLFLLYSLTTAYVAGSGSIVAEGLNQYGGYTIPGWLGSVPLLLLFGFFVFMGTKLVDYLNRVLMIGLTIAFAMMIFFLAPHVDGSMLERVEWRPLLMGISVVATSYGFHIIIPTLSSYFHRDFGKLKKAILIGSAIPLLVYVLWELLALGIIPVEGASGIQEGYQIGANGAQLIAEVLHDSHITLFARCFAFFAIVTSFLGVSISLFDFLADGFRIKKTPMGRLLLYALTFIPPVLFTLTDPRAFLSALEYAGAFGVVTLLGLMPALMVWRGRYHYHMEGHFRTPGGKPALIAVMLFSLFVMLIELANKSGMIKFY